MVKRTKRYNKRPQKGGLFGFFEEEKVEEPGVTNNVATTDSGYFSSFKMPEVSNFKMPELSNPFASAPAPIPDPIPDPVPVPVPVPIQDQTPTPYQGGKRSKRMRGGIGSSHSLGLTYYATPVNGIKVAEPTYMEYYKGGRRRSRRMRGGTTSPSSQLPILSTSYGGSRRRSRKFRKGKKCNKTCRKRHRHCRR